MPTTLVQPQRFDATNWPLEVKPPAGYTGVQFDFAVVAELVQYVDHETVRILGTDVHAVDFCDGQRPSDPNHPICFLVSGSRMDFFVSIWADRLQVENVHKETNKILSVDFPTTVAHLRVTLQGIVSSSA